MSSKPTTLDICGDVMNMQMMGHPLGCCTKPPGHKGEHGCMIDFQWPADDIILGHSDPEQHAKIQANPPTLMTWTIRCDDEQRPYLELAMKREAT